MRQQSYGERERERESVDREERAVMRAERDAEINWTPDAPEAVTPPAVTPNRAPVREFVDPGLCAFCGETSRRCRCWE